MSFAHSGARSNAETLHSNLAADPEFLQPAGTDDEEFDDAEAEPEATESAQGGDVGDFYQSSIEGWNGESLIGEGVVVGKVVGDRNTRPLAKERLREIIIEFAKRHANGVRTGRMTNPHSRCSATMPARPPCQIREGIEGTDDATFATAAKSMVEAVRDAVKQAPVAESDTSEPVAPP